MRDPLRSAAPLALLCSDAETLAVTCLGISTRFAGALLLLSACGSGSVANAQNSYPQPELQDPIMESASPALDSMEPTIATQGQPTTMPKAAAAETHQSIRISIKGFRNTKGQALVSLFASSKGFPDNGTIAQKRKAYRIVGDEIAIRFDDVKPGSYAVAVLHDEDKDFKMKTGLFGIPKEGYGVSNDATRRFGPPKFADAKFEVTANDEVQLIISMVYY